MKAKLLPPVEVLREHFRYDPWSGDLYYLVGPREGKVAGSIIQSTGYRILTIGGRGGPKYLAHRVIWKLVTGEEPDHIDHRDLGRSNTWTNLRNGTKSQNQGNRLARADNRLGLKNIHWSEERERWVVQIKMGDTSVRRRTKTLAGAIAYQRLMSATLFQEFARAS